MKLRFHFGFLFTICSRDQLHEIREIPFHLDQIVFAEFVPLHGDMAPETFPFFFKTR